MDIGSGHGQMLVAVAQNGGRVYGVDNNKDRITWSQRRLALHGIEGTIKKGIAEQLPYEDKSMDVVFLLHVLEHVNSHQDTLREIARVLRPNGLLIVNAPNRFAWKNIKKDPHYNLPLVCTLPPKLGKFLTVDVLHCIPSYTVGLFPVCSRFKTLLIKNGFSPIEGTHTWMDKTRGWTRLKRWLRCNVIEGSFTVISEKN